jgi:hypothetical protein
MASSGHILEHKIDGAIEAEHAGGLAVVFGLHPVGFDFGGYRLSVKVRRPVDFTPLAGCCGSAPGC